MFSSSQVTWKIFPCHILGSFDLHRIASLKGRDLSFRSRKSNQIELDWLVGIGYYEPRESELMAAYC